MEIFYSNDCDGKVCRLNAEESIHCIRVLRHRTGDEIRVVDGLGTLFVCRLTDDSPKGAVAAVSRICPHWGEHPYSLHMAVCPTKNNERFEWFAEKATELGVDVISPVIGERSERRTFKTDRTRKIVLSAMKQSLKAKLPRIEEPVSVRDFILSRDGVSAVKMIACCFEGEQERRSIQEMLRSAQDDLIVLIGPEGDFSPGEARLAIAHGFIPVHLGSSRLRTETAALAAVTAVYLQHLHASSS